MSFNIKLDLDENGAVAKIKGVETGLSNASSAATGFAAVARTAMAEAKAATDAAAVAADKFKTILASGFDKNSARGQKVFKEMETAADAATEAQKKANAAINEMGKALASVGKTAFGGLTEQLQREADVLERIKGPMRQYQTDVAALEILHKRGTISAVEFEAELDRLNKKYHMVQGPIAPGPARAATGAAAGGGGAASQFGTEALDAVAPHLGATGQLLAGFATSGTVAAAAVVALGYEVIKLSDAYTTLSNKVQRFTESGQNAREILDQQYELSKKLHADLSSTAELYARVRDETNELNLSERQQAQLTNDIGAAVIAAGQSAGAAESLVRRLSLSFETGTISGRELRSIMRQFPEVATAFADKLGKPQAELIQLANKGELSAKKIIDAFHAIAPEMEARLNRMPETFEQKWQHAKDSVVLHLHDLMHFLDPGAGAQDEQDKVDAADQRRLTAIKALNKELETNARLTPIIAAAQSRGISVGAFDKESADKIAAMRIAMRGLGIDITDAFDQAKSKATQYGAEVDKIRDAHASQQIADDAKRIYDAMFGVDDLLKKQSDHWKDVADKIDTAHKLLLRMKALRDTSGAPESQEEREAKRLARDLAIEQDDAKYGKGVVGNAQQKAQAADQVRDWTRALHDGEITQEAFRRKYDELVTTMNDGRLPEIIKYWEAFHLPQEQFRRDAAALDSMLSAHTITIGKWRVEMQKAADAAGSGELWKKLDQHIAPLKPNSEANAREVYEAQVKQQSAQEALGDQFVEPARVYEQKLQDVAVAIRELGLTQQAAIVLQRQARDQFDSTAEAVSRVTTGVAGYQSKLQALSAQRDSGSLSGEQFQKGIAQLDRETKIIEQVQQPLVAYKQALADIAGAVQDYGLSQVYANAMTRQAREAYVTANEALTGTKEILKQLEAPAKAYNKSLAELEDVRAVLTAEQYAKALDKIRLTYLTASEAGKTFAGGLEATWLKAKQDAEGFGLQVGGQLIGDVDKLNEAFVSMANGGTVAWGQMIDQMIQDLERLILKQLEVAAINALMTAATGGVPIPGAAAVTGGSGIPAAIGDGTARMSPGAYPTAPTTNATFRSAAPAASPTVEIHNHYDSSVAYAAIDSRQGRQLVVNHLRAEQPAVRSYSGTRR